MLVKEKIIQHLRARGFRITKTREAMIELFTEVQKPISANLVLTKLQKNFSFSVHKVTIYRELDFLEEEKILQSVDFGDLKKRYELRFRAHHHHVVCTSCHRIEDVVLLGHLKKEIATIQKQKHFCVTSHALEFFGLCAKCR
ncbi:MAG: hypothetical protein COT25_04945 [Candidatus Kerfeldbacteria bacterium CG08_land_8_20_14_0_20_42_7]|uniref:Transcriptional repressor n=1 Tax=Candidatus Kerfeldbacteria bacterium CG08_land_8_20_14_0_20_42_7 TaxID=2014245 RepID=A0A2H0YRG1_9BACT|nr:MAG: hypothetical protein COT25_04945 [Candidatus Kerfeldbacteria bacterium CG08_land_8_20_14_0_20_42_7]